LLGLAERLWSAEIDRTPVSPPSGEWPGLLAMQDLLGITEPI
jgi:hypothetical protein